jgi:hypothetical protein
MEAGQIPGKGGPGSAAMFTAADGGWRSASSDLALEILKQGCESGRPPARSPLCSGVMAGHSGSGSRTGSAPFPQLLPGLDECLHLSGTRKTVVDQPAVLIRLLVKITNRRHAEVREVVTEFFELLLAQNLRLLAIRTARHWESDFSMFAICSPMSGLCAAFWPRASH